MRREQIDFVVGCVSFTGDNGHSEERQRSANKPLDCTFAYVSIQVDDYTLTGIWYECGAASVPVDGKHSMVHRGILKKHILEAGRLWIWQGCCQLECSR